MQVIQQQFQVAFSYPVVFTRNVFDPANPVLADLLAAGEPGIRRALVVIDSEVVRLNPGLLAQISLYGEAHRARMVFAAPPFQVRGGEICKHEPSEVAEIGRASCRERV